MTKIINWLLFNICPHTPELGCQLPWGGSDVPLSSFITSIKSLIRRPGQSRLMAAPSPDPGSGPGFCLPLLHLLLTNCCSKLTKLNSTNNKTGPNYARMLHKANFNFGVKPGLDPPFSLPPPTPPDGPRELSSSGVGWWRLIGLL